MFIKIFKFFVFLFSFGLSQSQAQLLSVGKEESLMILPGTEFSFDQLILTPSIPLLISNNNISMQENFDYLNSKWKYKTYVFSSDFFNYSGTIRVGYKDLDVKKITEDNLKIQLHQHHQWNILESHVERIGNWVESNPNDTKSIKAISLKIGNINGSFRIVTNPVMNGMVKLEVYQPGEFSIFNNDGKFISKKYYVIGQHILNLSMLAHATYFLTSGTETKKFIL